MDKIVPTRKEYLQIRFDKANIYLVGYLIGLDTLLKEDKISLDVFEQILSEIEQLPIWIQQLMEEPIIQQPRFSWDRWFDYDNLSQENGE